MKTVALTITTLNLGRYRTYSFSVDGFIGNINETILVKAYLHLKVTRRCRLDFDGGLDANGSRVFRGPNNACLRIGFIFINIDISNIVIELMVV